MSMSWQHDAVGEGPDVYVPPPLQSAYERMNNPRVCEAFAWLGQPLSSCDRCGKPYWWHSHDENPDREGGPFAGRWKRTIISTERATEMWRRHGGVEEEQHVPRITPDVLAKSDEA